MARGAALSPVLRRRAHGLTILLLTAAVVVAVDHLAKWLVARNLRVGQEIPTSGPITVHHIENRGAAFGLFPGMQGIFLLVAVAVVAYILVAGHRFGGNWLTQVTLGAILGGAVANAVDRLVQGYVVDFVDLHVWPVFNIADACIVVGIAVAVLTFGERRE